MSATQTQNGSTWKWQHITLAAHVELSLLFIVFTYITAFTATASVSTPFIDFATEIPYNNKKVVSTIEITEKFINVTLCALDNMYSIIIF